MDALVLYLGLPSLKVTARVEQSNENSATRGAQKLGSPVEVKMDPTLFCVREVSVLQSSVFLCCPWLLACVSERGRWRLARSLQQACAPGADQSERQREPAAAAKTRDTVRSRGTVQFSLAPRAHTAHMRDTRQRHATREDADSSREHQLLHRLRRVGCNVNCVAAACRHASAT